MRDAFWLTGTSYEDLIQRYAIDRPRDLKVTEIGVGLQTVTCGLIAGGNDVTAIDIAPEALVGLDCETLLVEMLPYAAPADLAICHLVFQHNSEEMVDWLLGVPLKPGGIIAFQYAWSSVPASVFTDESARSWLVWHFPDRIAELCEKHSLDVFWQRSDHLDFDGVSMEWEWTKARKR